MANRQVTQSRKDKDGDITALCNPSKDWSPRYKSNAISDIESGTHRYYVVVGRKEVDIHVVKLNGKKHLRTDPDETKRNNLDDLPDC